MEFISILIIVVVYLIAGFYGALIGGGALLTVPVLLFSGLSPHHAIGTNKIGAFGIGLGASTGYGLEKKINYKLGIIFMLFASIGAVLGALVVLSVPEYIIKKVIGLIIIIISIFLFFDKTLGTKIKNKKKNTGLFVLFAICSGVYSGFYGAGIGTINRLVLSAFFAYAVINSAALSSFAAIAVNFVALAIFAYFGVVEYSLAVPIILASSTGAYLGSRYGSRIGNAAIKRLLLIASIIMAIKLLFF